MTTTKGDLRSLLAIGFSILTVALVLFVVGGVSGSIDAAGPVFLALMGVVTLGVTVGRQPFWALTRARQMDRIVAEVAEVAAMPPAVADRPGDPDPV